MPPDGRLALLRRIRELEDRLEEAEETLRAIRSGEVDAVVASGPEGDQVYTLKGADEAYRILVQGMSEGAVTLTPEGLILFANDQFASLVRWPPAQVVGSRLQQFVAPEDAAILTALLSGGRASKAEVRLKRSDGTLVPAYLSADTLALEGLECICLVATDLSEQKRNEEIIASEKLARSILEQAASAILVVDPAGRIVQASRAAGQLAGGPVLLRRFDDVFALSADPDGRTCAFAEILDRLQRGDKVSSLQASAQTTDARELRLLVNAALLTSADSRLLGCILSLSDVTELQRLVTTLRQRDEERELQARLKDEFLALLGHELRNPLAAIYMAAQLVAPGVSAERRAALDEMIGRQVEVLRRLVDDLLDLARITHGQIELRKECLDLARFLHKVVADARSAIASRGQELVLRMPSESVLFMADAVRLEQITTNLLNNASKYTPRGGRIELSGAVEGAEVVLRCKDNGRGIPPEMRQMIFEPFIRLQTAGESGPAGVGVGLALVKRLVGLHDGTVTVESGGPGMGSEFVVRLPLVQPAAARLEDAGEAPTPRARRGLSVAVVEDNSDVAQGLAMVLEQAGHKPSLFADGASALAGLARLKPDVVLLDVGLPDMDGYELAARLRQREELRRTPFVAVSGFKRRVEAGEAQGDFDHYLLKPVDSAELLALLGRLTGPAQPSGAEDSAGGAPAPKVNQGGPRGSGGGGSASLSMTGSPKRRRPTHARSAGQD